MLRIFSLSVPKRLVLLLVMDYALIVGSLVAATYLTTPLTATMYLLYEGGAQMEALAGVFGVVGLFFTDKYRDVRVISRVALVIDVVQAFGIVLLCEAVVAYFRTAMLSPRILSLGIVIGTVAIYTWRNAYSGILWSRLPTDRVLFLGYDSRLPPVLEEARARPVLGISVVGCVDDSPPPEGSLKWLGGMDNFEQTLQAANPTRVVLAHHDQRLERLQKCLFSLHLQHIAVERFSSFYERLLRRVCAAHLRPSAVVLDRELDARPGSLALQSIYTNLFALLSAALLAPVGLAIGLAIRVYSREAALIKRPRLGLNRIPFNLYEFRCRDRAGRLTGLGRRLTKHHLKKLPCLLNVIRGEMALIGPPAQRSEFASVLGQWIPCNAQRQMARPGIIGWSQLHAGLDGGDENTRLEYDLYYIKHISLTLDAYIILSSMRKALVHLTRG